MQRFAQVLALSEASHLQNAAPVGFSLGPMEVLSSKLIAIMLNGESRSVSATTVAGLLAELQLQGKRVAVERNRELVSRESYENIQLNVGDEIEIVTFVGGG